MGRGLVLRAATVAATVLGLTAWAGAIGAGPDGRLTMAQHTTGQEGDGGRRPADVSRLLGVWRGTYLCAQGPTGLTLTVSGRSANTVEAVFAFYAVPENRSVRPGRFRMSGVFDESRRTLDLWPGAWLERPPGYLTVSLRLSVDLEAGEMTGSVSGPGCSRVRLTRDRTL